LPIFYNAREGDASVINCLADCDVDPECAASYLVYETCYYNYQPTSYETSDDPEAVLAVRAAAPDPYPDENTTSSNTISSSSGIEVPPIYEAPTT
jgi:hypothetical protein